MTQQPSNSYRSTKLHPPHPKLDPKSALQCLKNAACEVLLALAGSVLHSWLIRANRIANSADLAFIAGVPTAQTHRSLVAHIWL